jgi:hypothetical protein
MEKLLKIDRRILFVLVALAVTIPLLFRFKMPVPPTRHVISMYNKIDSLSKDSHVLISFDYDPSSKEELQPMARAVLHHCFKKDIKVIGMTLYPAGTGLAEKAIREIGNEYEKKSGRDYVFLGFKAGSSLVILNMGEDIYTAFQKDFYGKKTVGMQALKGVSSLRDIDYAVNLTAGGIYEAWIVYGREKYNFDLGVGCTAVMGPEMYPFIQSKQLNGFMGGLKGAAEYETLIDHKDRAAAGMAPQSVVHVLVVCFILFGNFIYFASGRKK